MCVYEEVCVFHKSNNIRNRDEQKEMLPLI